MSNTFYLLPPPPADGYLIPLSDTTLEYLQPETKGKPFVQIDKLISFISSLLCPLHQKYLITMYLWAPVSLSSLGSLYKSALCMAFMEFCIIETSVHKVIWCNLTAPVASCKYINAGANRCCDEKDSKHGNNEEIRHEATQPH